MDGFKEEQRGCRKVHLETVVRILLGYDMCLSQGVVIKKGPRLEIYLGGKSKLMVAG